MSWTTEYFETTSEEYFNTSELFTTQIPISINKKTGLSIYQIVIPIFGAIIILLNLIVVVSSGLILKKGVNPKTTYLFLGNVAMADLITGFAVVFGSVYPKENRDFMQCCIHMGLIVSSTLASIYSVGLIAVDRFLYIIHGLQYQRWITPIRARFMILATWIFGIIFGFLPAMGWYEYNDQGKICWFIRLATPEMIILTSILGFIPVVLVVILYSIILYYAIRKVIQLRNAGTDNKKSNNIRIFRGGNKNNTGEETTKRKNTEPSEWRAVTVVLLTTGSFVLTWMPYFISCCVYIYCEKNTPGQCNKLKFAIASPLAILGFLNSLFNPLIYAWWHKGFRMNVKKMIPMKLLRKSKVSSSPESSVNKTSSTDSKKTTKSSTLSNELKENSSALNEQSQNTHL